MQSPAPRPLDHFLSGWGTERAWGQILIRREPAGFELRHQADRSLDAAQLRLLDRQALRALAETDEAGAFRPHHLAPTLRRGWRCLVPDPRGLGEALEQVYPGTVDDWAALMRGDARPVEFSTVASRQLGRARALQQLRGQALASVIHAACSTSSCLKQRRWTAAGVLPDDADGKSAIPCLEPCPLFLGFARACTAADAVPEVPGALTPAELATLHAALRHALAQPPPGVRAGDWSEPLHPKRVARLLDLRAEWLARSREAEARAESEN